MQETGYRQQGTPLGTGNQRARLLATRFRIGALLLRAAALKAGFDPNQPRVPAGNPRGGQWTSGGGGGGGGEVLSDANPDIFAKPGSRLAQNTPRGRGTVQVRVGPRALDATPAQASRYALANARAEARIDRVREVDPSWRPRPSAFETIEGAIRAREAEAREATQRLAELARRPARELIDAYRGANNARDLFGREVWPRDRDTVAVASINNAPVFGVNSSAPTYLAGDKSAAQRVVEIMAAKYPHVKRGNLGERPNDALYHAEATVLLRAAKINGGSLAGRRLEVYVDREMCGSCRKVLPLLTRELGNPTVIFVSPSGVRRTTHNGEWVERGRQ